MDRVAAHDAEMLGLGTADLGLWLALAERTGGRVLELGAGAGRVAVALAATGCQVTALDSDLELLRAAAARGPVEPFYADMRDFAAPRQFDLVFVADGTLQTLARDERVSALRCARGALRPGGVFAAMIFEALPTFEGDTGIPGVVPSGDLDYGAYVHAISDCGGHYAIEHVVQVARDGVPLELAQRPVDVHKLTRSQLDEELAEAGLTPAGSSDVELPPRSPAVLVEAMLT